MNVLYLTLMLIFHYRKCYVDQWYILLYCLIPKLDVENVLHLLVCFDHGTIVECMNLFICSQTELRLC